MVQRELRKSFRSIKGIILSVLTIAGGGGLAMLFAQSDDVRQKKMHESDIAPETLIEFKSKLFGWYFMDQKTGEHLSRAPGLIFFLFAVSLVLMPAVVLLLGFDSVSADRQHKTVRYWTIRSRRSSYIIGKWVGLWMTCSIVALGMHALIWIIAAARGEAPFAEIVSWGFRFWAASLPILGMWCAVSVFISSLMKIPILALLTTAGTFFMWWLVYIIFWSRGHNDVQTLTFMDPSPVCFLFPNFYDRFLLSPQVGQFMTGLAVCFGFAAALLAASSQLFAKRDV